jgi:hypothetical protein
MRSKHPLGYVQHAVDLFITGDSDQESGISEVVLELADTRYRQHFEALGFGGDVAGICVVMMGRDPRHGFKQRIRFVKKDRTFYVDVMLPYEHMIAATLSDRKRLAITLIYAELSRILKKYKLKDFDLAGFLSEFATFFSNMKWIDKKLPVVDSA